LTFLASLTRPELSVFSMSDTHLNFHDRVSVRVSMARPAFCVSHHCWLKSLNKRTLAKHVCRRHSLVEEWPMAVVVLQSARPAQSGKAMPPTLLMPS
jgi:hypothetical protein